MSLLADLLSKIKQPQAKREVPPNLRNIVRSAAGKSARNKIVLLSIILIIFTAAGLGVTLFVTSLERTSSETVVPTRRDITVKPKKRGQTPQTKPADQAEAVPAPDKTAAPAEAMKAKEMPPDKKEPVQSDPLPIAEKTVETPKEVKGNNAPAVIIQAEPSSDFNLDALLYSAWEHEMNNEYIKALANYKKVLESDRNNITIINTIAFIYLELDLLQESITYARRALEIDENYTPSLINLGIVHAKSERAHEAEQYFMRALALEPHNRMVLLNLAILNERKSNYDDASAHYAELVRLGDLEGLLGLARIYDTQGMTERAVEYYRRAYAHDAADNKTKLKVRQRIMLLINMTGGS